MVLTKQTRSAIISLLVLLATPGSVYAQESSSRQVAVGTCMPLRDLSRANLVFSDNESLEYQIQFKLGLINTDVAKASFTLSRTTINGEDVYASRLFGQTAKFYDRLFKLREDFQSWFTVDDLVPVKFFRDTREGRYTCTNDYKFIWDSDEPYISADIETSKKPMRNVQIPLTACTFDPMTLFYIARNMDMNRVERDKEYPMTFAVADDVYTIYFVYIGKESKVLKEMGTVESLKFAIQVVEGDVFTGDSDLFMWFSDDENKIPVYFEAPLRIGFVCGRLRSAEGLKHEFSSLKPKQ